MDVGEGQRFSKMGGFVTAARLELHQGSFLRLRWRMRASLPAMIFEWWGKSEPINTKILSRCQHSLHIYADVCSIYKDGLTRVQACVITTWCGHVPKAATFLGTDMWKWKTFMSIWNFFELYRGVELIWRFDLEHFFHFVWTIKPQGMEKPSAKLFLKWKFIWNLNTFWDRAKLYKRELFQL